jgi:hypothetical protein
MMMPSRTLTAIAVIRYSEGSMSPGCAQWEIVRSIVSLQYWQRESCHLGATAENDESSRRLVSVETVTIALDDNAIRGPLRLAGKGKYARNASEELFHFGHQGLVLAQGLSNVARPKFVNERIAKLSCRPLICAEDRR